MEKCLVWEIFQKLNNTDWIPFIKKSNGAYTNILLVLMCLN